MSLFSGLAAFPITPANADGRVDAPALRDMVGRLVRAKVDSIGLLGSTGTYAYLPRAERRRAIEAALDEVGGKVSVMAASLSVGSKRTSSPTRM